MASDFTLAEPIVGAPITGLKIVLGEQVHMTRGKIILLLELFGDPGIPTVQEVLAAPAIPEQPYVAATNISPEIPYRAAIPAVEYVAYVAGIPAVVHPQKWSLEITNTISECLVLDPRSVHGLKKVRRQIPGAFSMVMGAGFQVAANGGEAETGMIETMLALGMLPDGSVG